MADPTREGAFDLIAAVLDQRCPLEEALDGLPAMEARDRAAAHRLAATVLRRLGTLDAVVEPYLRKAPPDPVRHVLRIGAAGAVLLETPGHAAVATAVALARTRGLTPFAGLINAVLRRVTEAGSSALSELDGPRLDTPAWLWASWRERARAIATAHQSPAPLDLTLRSDGDAPQGGRMLPTGSVRFPPGTRPTELEGFRTGTFWVQDAAAALAAKLLHLRPGERVADLCAAPGGKTAQLAAIGADVTAIDRDATRMARLQENLGRLQLKATTVVTNALTWRPPAPLDAVLLDAPCSATGTIRRHPDIPHLKRPKDVAAMAQEQQRLLLAAIRMLRPGGRLVYSVCSLQPQEGAPVVAQAVARGEVRVQPFHPHSVPGLESAITPEGYIRTDPGLWADLGGMDGFFVAGLVRV